jgi:V/A-type H+/Na+-transporting ATPase subunit I
MITEIEKYLIIGAQSDLDLFFERAQQLGFLEFISLSSPKTLEVPITLQTLISAIKILKKQPMRKTYEGGGDLLLAMQVAERASELKDDLTKLYSEKKVLDNEISRVAPFGHFSMQEIHDIEKRSGRKVHFFCMKTAKTHTTDFPLEVLYINTEYDLDYFIQFSPNPVTIPGMIEMHIDAPLGELEGRLDFVEDAIHRFETELKDLAGHIEFLQQALIEELNSHNLSRSKKEVAYPLSSALFVIEAFVPKDQVAHLHTLANQLTLFVEPLAIEAGDKVPTCLRNSGASLVGEDLIKIYDIPSIDDYDPSSWVLTFFALFFAVIVGDAGYGALLLALAFYLKKKFPYLRGLQKRMLRLMFILSTACIVWGVSISSYFGIKIAPTSPLSRISPLHYLVERKAAYHLKMKDDVYQAWVVKFPQIKTAQTGDEMLTLSAVQKKKTTSYQIVDEFSGNLILELTILFGILHITLGFLRYLRRNIAGLGWILFMFGGYLFFPSLLNATILPEFMGWISRPAARLVGMQLLFFGIGFATVAALIQRRWKGISEITNMVQVFADVLSYLRLYALSLAGAIMASTFNQEGSALGYFFGFIVIFIGHCINMLLSFMGGIVHGLRLNFLEWYHYCFDGGGRLFKPLKKIK